MEDGGGGQVSILRKPSSKVSLAEFKSVGLDTLFSLYLAGIYHFSLGIKRQKSKSKNDFPSLANIEAIVKEMSALSDCEERFAKNLPSAFELAHLAAILSKENSANVENAVTFAKQAWELWNACSVVRREKIKEGGEWLRHIDMLMASGQQLDEGIPNPTEYPVTLDEFLKLALPKRRVADRMKLYREHLRACLRHDLCYPKQEGDVIPLENIPIPSDEDITKLIQYRRKTGFNERSFGSALTELRKFAEHESKNKRLNRAKSGAEALKAKRLMNKHFGDLLPPNANEQTS